ncbi:MAG: hypothetical protein WD830_02980, partial [Chloroflexota bacterium]
MRSPATGSGAARSFVAAVVLIIGVAPASAATSGRDRADVGIQTGFVPSAYAPTIAFKRLGQAWQRLVPVTVSWPAASPDGAPIA